MVSSFPKDSSLTVSARVSESRDCLEEAEQRQGLPPVP